MFINKLLKNSKLKRRRLANNYQLKYIIKEPTSNLFL